MESDNKRKRNSGVSQARVGKYRTLKKLREDFSQGNDPDSTNKSVDDQSGCSVVTNSCDYADNQDAVTDIIKLEPSMNLDFLAEDDAASAFSGHDNCFDNFDKRTSSPKPPYPSEYEQLRKWAVDSKIDEQALQELLDILRKRLMPDLPGTVKEFLEETPSKAKEPPEPRSVTLSGSEFQTIMAKLNSMQADIREIASNQRHLDHLVRSSNLVPLKQTEQSFADKYDLELPLKDLEKLFAFESLLTANAQCKKDFMSSLNFLLEEKLSKSALGIMKKFLHREVALKWTAVKQMEGKFVMKLDVPTMWNCIVDILMTYHKTSEKEVHASIGTVLTNAKDWDGFRAHRDKSRDSSGKPTQGWPM